MLVKMLPGTHALQPRSAVLKLGLLELACECKSDQQPKAVHTKRRSGATPPARGCCIAAEVHVAGASRDSPKASASAAGSERSASAWSCCCLLSAAGPAGDAAEVPWAGPPGPVTSCPSLCSVAAGPCWGWGCRAGTEGPLSLPACSKPPLPAAAGLLATPGWPCAPSAEDDCDCRCCCWGAEGFPDGCAPLRDSWRSRSSAAERGPSWACWGR